MVEQLAIAINSRVRDVIREHALQDEDNFSKLFSRGVAERLKNGEAVEAAVDKAFRQAGKTFSMLNRSRAALFKQEVVDRIRPFSAERGPLLNVLREFKHHAERELVHGFKGKNRTEEYCRSNLQSWLGRTDTTRREVVSGGGLIDVLASTGEPVEAKLWKGQEYYQEGIEELREYMRTERRQLGYYVVFDTLSDNPNLSDEAELEVPEGRIIQVGVRMTPGPPSRRRRARRRAD